MSIYRITVKASHSTGGAQYTTHHYQFPDYVPTAGELLEVVQGLADIFEETLLALFFSGVTFQEIEARRVDIGDQPTEILVPDGWPIVGTGAGNSFPSVVAAVLRWTAPTEFPRSGRVYLPSFIVGAGGSGGGLSTAVLAVMDTAALAMEEIAVTGQVDAQRVAVHYGGDPRAVTAFNLLFARPTHPQFGVQRRRRAGRGI